MEAPRATGRTTTDATPEEGGSLLVEGVALYPELTGLAGGPARQVLDGAVWIERGVIRAVGPRPAVREAAGPGVPRLDGQGALAVPGLVDSHLHLGAWAARRHEVDLGGCRSLQDAVERLRRRAATLLPGQWVVGRSLAPHELGSGPPEDASWLDAAFPDRPAVVWSKDLHSVFLNRAARTAAGIGPAFEDWPAGAVARRDPRTGDWDGVFREKAVEVVRQALPRPSVRELADAVEQAQEELVRLGLVCVHVPEGPDVLGALGALHQRGALRLKVRFMPPAAMLEHLAALGLRQGFGDDRLRLGPVKAFADGSLGSLTAALLEPYSAGSRPGYRGELLMDRAAVAELAIRAASAGFAVAVHAIGDRACREVLDGIEAAAGRGGSVEGFPHRIEHVQLLDRRDAPRLGRLGVVASVQPVHLVADRAPAQRYWQGRTAGAYAFRWMLDGGGVLAMGSDAPVEDPDPLAGIRAAVLRRGPVEEGRTLKAEEGPWHPEQALSAAEALVAYTRGGAAACGEAGRRGQLRPGMAGDVVLVAPDLLGLERSLGQEGWNGTSERARRAREALARARVAAVIVDGRLAFGA